MQSTWRDWLWNHVKRWKWIEWGVIIAILGVVVALIMPATRSGSSGDLLLPVRVLVFDAVSRAPISGAVVEVTRGPYAGARWSAADLAETSTTYWSDGFNHDERQLTNAEGIAEVTFRFYTGANHLDPIPKANTGSVWVMVKAEKYGGCLIPLRYRRIPNEQLREAGIVHVMVGLFPSP